MFDSGGMPSSHTSLVVGLTTAIGYQYGLGSTMFPLSLAFSLIVMYDAAGVRRHAGKQAEVLNRILDDMFHGESISEKKLKEVLGHSPLQVLAGAVLGVFIAVLYAHKFGSGYASLSC
jgi:acid phosphatase family membrane protein YuiD